MHSIVYCIHVVYIHNIVHTLYKYSILYTYGIYLHAVYVLCIHTNSIGVFIHKHMSVYAPYIIHLYTHITHTHTYIQCARVNSRDPACPCRYIPILLTTHSKWGLYCIYRLSRSYSRYIYICIYLYICVYIIVVEILSLCIHIIHLAHICILY